MTRYSFLSLLLAWALLSAPAHAVDAYSAEPIEAWVIDAETNKPIEGVIVTANWELSYGTAGGSVSHGQMMVMECVTDKEGRFYFPAWGPKPIPSFSVPARDAQEALYLSVFPIELHLVNRDPALLLFKRDYKYLALVNQFTTNYNKGSLRRSQWNGKTIKMERFKGTMEEYVRHLSFLMGGLRFIEDDCQWKKTPRMLMALQEQADIFKASGIVSDIYRIDFLPTDEKKCGSVKEYFRRYQQ